MKPQPLFHCRSGFTLIELMVTLTVAAILLAIGIPSFQQMIRNQRITAASNDFLAAIFLTRSEAISRGTRVDLVPTGGGTDWTQGWVVFIDENDNQKPDKGERIIFSHGPVPDGMEIQSNLNGQYISYTGAGRTRTNASSQAPQFGSLLFRWDQQQERKIIINFLGRARICNPALDGSSC